MTTANNDVAEKEESNQQQQYYFIKLKNGEDILCHGKSNGIATDDFMQIYDPVMIISEKIPVGQGLADVVYFKPWVPYCNAMAEVSIPTEFILIYGSIQDPYLSKYQAYITHMHQTMSFSAEGMPSNLNFLNDLSDGFDESGLYPVDGHYFHEEEYDDDDDEEEEQIPTPPTGKKQWIH